MNILFILNNRCIPKKGGLERATDTITRGLYALGHKIAILYSSRISLRDTENICAKEYCMPAEKPYIYDSAAKDYYKDLLSKLDIDVIIFQNAITDNRYFFLENAPCKIKKIACINNQVLHRVYPSARFCEYNFSSLKGTIWKSFWHILPSLARRMTLNRLHKEYLHLYSISDKIVLLANSYKTQLKESFKLSTDKFITIHNSFSFPNEILNQKYDKEKIILFVGRISEYYKNAISFIKIWEKIYKQNPEWKALMIGDDNNNQNLHNYINEHKIKRIDIKEFTDPVPYYQKASILCMTSFYEGFGNVLIEAMAFGCVPSAFDNAKAASEIFDNNISGLLIPSYDLNKYADSLNKIMNDETALLIMQQRAKEKSKEFAPEKIIKQWDDMIKNL